MIFIDNKYTRWYYKLITNAQLRNLSTRKQAKEVLGHPELHHIIPRSLNGSNEKDNLVYLSTREHLICHIMLTRMTNGDSYKKMIYAANRMLSGTKQQARYMSSNRMYAALKEKFAKVNPFNDPVFQKNNALKSVGRRKSESHKAALAKSWTTERKLAAALVAKETHTGKPSWNSGKTCPQMSGPNNGFYGKTHTPEERERQRLLRVGKPAPWAGLRMQCEHCGKDLDKGNYIKSHGDKCKLKNNTPGSLGI